MEVGEYDDDIHSVEISNIQAKAQKTVRLKSGKDGCRETPFESALSKEHSASKKKSPRTLTHKSSKLSKLTPMQCIELKKSANANILKYNIEQKQRMRDAISGLLMNNGNNLKLSETQWKKEYKPTHRRLSQLAPVDLE